VVQEDVMVELRAGSVLHYLRRALAHAPGAEVSDAELLERFVKAADREAFELLVWRHQRMVFEVCRRVLRNHHDAEDAFQATFLVLARKAASIGNRQGVAAWLHRIASRVAQHARSRASRRERPGGQAELASIPGRREPGAELLAGDLGPVLDEEVNRLPEKYRVSIVLCYLEGKTYEEAARQLGCPKGTLSGRLARARRLLQARLTRRGIGLGAGLLAAVLCEQAATAAAPAALVAATVQGALLAASGRAAAGATSPGVVALAEGVLRSMLYQKLRCVSMVLAALFACAGLGTYLAALHAGVPAELALPEQRVPEKKSANETKRADAERAALIGTWESKETLHLSGGSKPPETVERKVRWAVTADQILRLDYDGFVEEEWAYRLDPGKTPKAIDLRSRQFGTYLGVYLLDGDTLKVYVGAENRPAALPAKKDPLWDLRRVSRTLAEARRYANAPGCFWMVQPTTPGIGGGGFGLEYFYETDPEGAALVTMAYGLQEKPMYRDYRPVLLDAHGKRYLPDRREARSSTLRGAPGVVLTRWRLDPQLLKANQVARVGVEAVPRLAARDPARRLAAREAQGRAREAGLEVLPWPEVGGAYSFTLTTIDGRKLRSEDLKGKVVVIDCWASWCAPCMALLPDLKRCYERWHKDGLEVVGVSLDEDADTVRKVCERHGIPWPQVLAAAGEKDRRLWQEATGIETIPRVLVIGRDGVLRADTAADLEDEIAKLVTPPGGTRNDP
jgi:RNA polymerase sigma factor (sigma-70 family)